MRKGKIFKCKIQQNVTVLVLRHPIVNICMLYFFKNEAFVRCIVTQSMTVK